MKLSFLDPLTKEPGPWGSVYLDTSRDIDDPDKAIELRWRHQRDALRAQGADPATVSALESVIGTDQDLPGRHGQALFATDGHVVLVGELPEPPVRDAAWFGRLPNALPLAIQHAPDIPYVAITLTRDGGFLDTGEPDTGELAADEEREQGPDDHVLIAYEAGRWPISTVTRGRPTRLRVPAEGWQHAARSLAQEIADLADRHHAERIVLRRDTGEAWLSGVLVNRLPRHLQDCTSVVEEEPDTALDGDTGTALIEKQVAAVLDGRLSMADRRQVDAFYAQRARHPALSEGIPAVVAALQRGQAQAVLFTPPVRLRENLFAATDPDQIALSAPELEAFGASGVREEPAGAVLLHAALRTGAELIVLLPDETPLTDGVGVLLRYQDVADVTAL
ncbi:hypothetical protein K4749_37205 [Streptomyces sp. TRM72054]|uniref:baeRF2 domain-containing protein n=1 Tax=Streptomyces sp. TRM72054 TaxID=2870562 RepID=UPI001C8C70F5|nr:hypothetical protein [Streptomyces sp. TRM72054]MBX9399067.1 hypothetical protein [Streptomyces sp. TRM72054]